MHQFWSEVASRAKDAWNAGSLEPLVNADFSKYPITSVPGSAAAGIGDAYAQTVDQKAITKTAPGPGNPNAPRRLAAAKASGQISERQDSKSSVIEEDRPRSTGKKQQSESRARRSGPWNDLRSKQVARVNRKRKEKNGSDERSED